MVQIKLSITFLLAAAAIGPVVTQPIPDRTPLSRREYYSDEIEARLGGHSEGRHNHLHRHEGGFPADASSDNASPSRREYADEFEVRDSQAPDNEMKLMASLEEKVKKLQSQQSELERTHKTLEDKNKALENDISNLGHKRKDLLKEDKSLEGKNRALLRKKEALDKKDKALLREGQDLGLKNNKLKREGKKLELHDQVFTKEGDVLAHKDMKLKSEGKELQHHNEVLAKESGVLANKNKALEKKNNVTAPVVNSRPKLVTREFDDMFKRNFEEVEFDAREFDDEMIYLVKCAFP